MKHFKQFLLAVLVALSSSVTINAQTETRTVGINNLVDLDDVALLGEWTAIEHTNNSNPITKIIFSDNGSFENDINAHRIERKNGSVNSYSEYWTSGSMMGRFTLHLLYASRVAHFVIDKFEGDEMILSTYDQKEVITLKRNYSGGTETNGDFVDLGLPSGLLWAKYNLGATNEYESGDYYAWGETTPNKSVYNEASYTVDWNSMPWNISGTQYDPAYLTLGEGYRMPTKYEFDELISNCSWNYSDTEHGYRVTGPNGNSILFPFVGGKEEDYNVGYVPGWYYGQGFYMSGTKSEYDYLYNWYLYMDNDPRFGMYMYNAHRGQTIRPVSTITSAINSVSYSTNKKANVYSISGQLEKMNVSPEESLRDLPKGLHIINGTKVLVK